MMSDVYKDKIKLELTMRGYRVTSWSGGSAMTTEKFEKGSISGSYGVGKSGVIYLIEVNNSHPHNGQFSKFMDDLEEIAIIFKFPLYVVHIWEKRFADHLVNRRGYAETEQKDGYHVIFKRSLPQGLLDQLNVSSADSKA